MAFEIVRSRGCDRDLEAIFDYLVETYGDLGDPADSALERAAARVRTIEDDMEGLGRAPFQGTLRNELRPGLRQVTKNRAIFYFLVDDAEARIRVLAIFFGAQDHVAAMLRRLTTGEG